MTLDPQRRLDLDKHFAAFARDMWAFRVEVDEGNWDVRKLNMLISAIHADLRQAQQAWPKGESLLRRLANCVDKVIQIRHREHDLTASAPHKTMTSPHGFGEYHRASVRWQRAMGELYRQLEATGTAMLRCCDEIAEQTSVDIRSRLEGRTP